VTTNTLYSIIGDDHDVFVASWGDDLGVDLVPHASRKKSRTLHALIIWKVMS